MDDDADSIEDVHRQLEEQLQEWNEAARATLSATREARKRAEQDAQLLANRIALLKAEEQKAWTKIRTIQQKTQEVLDSRQRAEERIRLQELARRAKEEEKALQRKKIDEIKEQSQAARRAVKAIQDNKKAYVREARAERLSRELTLEASALALQLDSSPSSTHEVSFAMAPGAEDAAEEDVGWASRPAATAALSSSWKGGVMSPTGAGYPSLRTAGRRRALSQDSRWKPSDDTMSSLQREEKDLLGRIRLASRLAGIRPPRPQLEDAPPAAALALTLADSSQAPGASVQRSERPGCSRQRPSSWSRPLTAREAFSPS
eukprot:TRINITY_DN38774_c0_g1_i1.p1 TRINITY_DN38774_c0_g1~~TRINITY_DN38774_c0_g1_i1.p1  ORF type:complete len:318 (+),score=101.01 TRINITY_DN38774_c0_g1_i1:171-1124(+)